MAEHTWRSGQNCIKHGLNILSLVCVDCTASLCTECILTDHNGHRMAKAEEVVDDYRRQIKQSLTLNETIDMLRSSRTQLTKSVALVNDHVKSVRKEIDERTQTLLNDIIARGKICQEKAKLLGDKYLAPLLTQKHLIDYILEMFSSKLKRKQQFDFIKELSPNDAVAILSVLNNMKNRSPESFISSPPFSFEADPQFGDVVEDDSKHSDFVRFNADAGELDDTSSSDDEESDDDFFDCEGEPSVLQSSFTMNREISEIVPLSDTRAFIRCRSDLFYVTCFASGEWTKSLIECNVEQILYLQISSKTVVMKCEKTGFCTWYSAYILQPDNIMKNFCVLSITPGKLFESRSSCVCFGFLSSMLSGQTLTVKSFDEQGREKGTLSIPESSRFVTLKQMKELDSGLLVILYSGSFGDSRLEILDENLQKSLAMYTLDMMSIDYNLSDMSSFVTDNDGNIIIAVKYRDALYVLDKCGKFRGILLSYSDGIRKPSSVTLSKEGTLWIGSVDGEVFKPNYNTIARSLTGLQSKSGL